MSKDIDNAGYTIKGSEILKNQDDVEKIIFCALCDLISHSFEIVPFSSAISAFLRWRGYSGLIIMTSLFSRRVSLNPYGTILYEGQHKYIEIESDYYGVRDGRDVECFSVEIIKKDLDDERILGTKDVYKQPINNKFAFNDYTYDGLYDFLSEIFPRQLSFDVPAHLNVADLQSCFASQHADVELDPVRFYPRSLTKEIYKLEKANNGQVICRICNKPIEAFSDCSADHIVPYSKGGKTTLSNMQLAHKSCNSKKRDKIKIDDDENLTV